MKLLARILFAAVAVRRRARLGADGRSVDHHTARISSKAARIASATSSCGWTATTPNEDDPPVVDFDKMKKTVEALAIYCAKNPSHGLITAADEVMGK